jgi:hypothetical protein
MALTMGPAVSIKSGPVLWWVTWGWQEMVIHCNSDIIYL